ncbi:hypothetical protein LOD99_10690 [Oopsacas minuta]|uniref:Uncharacterized protein n=1 Tax=Oopsacas minuta TaxID=111878 RepID=A0AAV7KEW5_9METZ|nr:hypothetical protein LOD99_10690 [Oopsacas minuta]
MSDSPQLPRNLVTMERQKNAIDAFPSLKYRSSHKLSHDFIEENSDKRKSLPSTFHQVHPSNRDSNRISESSYGYVPYQPAPTPLNETVPRQSGHYEVLHSPTQFPVYCNLPFQNTEIAPSFVPLTRHNMADDTSQDSLDYIHGAPHRPRNNAFITPENDTFQPVKFITPDEDKPHTSHRSLVTPVSTRLFISTTPVDPDMVSLSASQDCIYHNDKNTQKKCIKLLSQSMNLNPDITSWVIPPTARVKRHSLASAGHSSINQSDESLEWQPNRADGMEQRKDKVFGKIISGIVGLFRHRPKRKNRQSSRKVDKRKSKIGVIEHLTPSGAPSHLTSTPRELSPLSRTSVSYQPHATHSNSPQITLFKELSVPLTSSPIKRASNVSRDTIRPQFDRQPSNQSNVSQDHTTSKPNKRHIKPTTLPLRQDDVYENLPFQKCATKPPLPHSNSIYSNIEEMARTCSDTLPPITRTPEPIKPRSISDTKNRTGFPDGIPYAGLRKSVAMEQKNVRDVGSTPTFTNPDKIPDHLTNNSLIRAEISTGPTQRKYSVPTTSTPHDHLSPLNRFNSVETLC